MAAAIPSYTSVHSSATSVHRVLGRWRWLTAAIALPFWALGTWLIYDTTEQALASYPDVDVGRILAGVALYGSVVLMALAGMVWLFRARVVIEGERMTVRGTIFTVVITPEQMEGYRYLNNTLHVYLKTRRFGVVLKYFERQHVIEAWVHARATDLEAQMLEEERKEISRDADLGLREHEKEARLARLHRGVAWGNNVIYAASAAAIVNYLFFEQPELAQFAIAVLVVIPFVLDLAALANRGHIRVDYDEGSQYPQILTAGLTSGGALAFMALIDSGALLDTRAFLDLLLIGTLVKALLWIAIDRARLATLKTRGAGVALLTLVGLCVMPMFWAGGSVYLINEHFDQSPVAWHATEVVAKDSGGSSIPGFEIRVAAWDDSRAEPLTIKVWKDDYEAFEVGMPVRVGVRDGALRIPWVAAVEAARALPPSDSQVDSRENERRADEVVGE